MTPFHPLPLLGNAHVQTILGNFLHRTPNAGPTRLHMVPLADGDRIVLHETLAPRMHDDSPIVLLVHGLGGCHRSGYLQRLARRFAQLGWRAFRIDLRGAGAGVRLARRFYSAACSPDIRSAVRYLEASFPAAPIAVAGFSLGGNIVLNFAAELAEAPMTSVRAIVAVAPPIDLVRCSELISRYAIYDGYFLRNLLAQVAQHERCFPELPRVDFPRRLTLRGFDDLYTAPRWGFSGALEYYQRASALSRIAAIRLPTFILTARDDPFVAVEPFERLSAPACVEIHISAQGGHLGFLGHDDQGGIRWAEAQLVKWFGKQCAQA